ncbi:MAG: KH domain-containing protein [Pedosphaera sp.]|nr:KH domain-containing protein [Pedosphaera sp.]MSU43493.1 KH domain-containing protein [Pedosphaera sp.]
MSSTPKATLEEMLKHLGFEATVEESDAEHAKLLNIQCEDTGRLIGRQGSTLADLQYITNRIAFQRDPSAPKVIVDAGNYRGEAREALAIKAREAAAKARRLGDVVEMGPLNSSDRFVVHNTLKEEPDITTESIEIEGTTDKVILVRAKK